jgi:hypothetical protein
MYEAFLAQNEISAQNQGDNDDSDISTTS